MTKKAFFGFLIVGLLITALAAIVTAQDADVQARIDNAMSAAPPAIAKDATIMDVNADGEVVVLKEGMNGWTCWPDNPVSPGNDPICLDAVFSAWNDAIFAGEDPELTEVGLSYMLQGGSDPSNTDPSLMEPAEGEDWIATPPHVMMVFPASFDLSKFSTDHESGEPYVMWAGTPYQHIMMPVNLEEMDH